MSRPLPPFQGLDFHQGNLHSTVKKYSKNICKKQRNIKMNEQLYKRKIEYVFVTVFSILYILLQCGSENPLKLPQIVED